MADVNEIIEKITKLNHSDLLKLEEYIAKEIRLSEQAIKEGFEVEE